MVQHAAKRISAKQGIIVAGSRKGNRWPRPKAKKIIVAAIIVVAGVALALTATLKKQVAPITVETEKVTRRTLVEKVTANGKIEPVVQVKISPEVSGEIIELDVKEGQHVKKGDLLLKIRPDNYVAARDSAAASYKLAVANKTSSEASLEKARLEYERSTGLYDGKLISDSDFLTAKTTYDVAKTTLAGAGENRSAWPRRRCNPPPRTFPRPPFILRWTARSANSIHNWESGSLARRQWPAP